MLCVIFSYTTNDASVIVIPSKSMTKILMIICWIVLSLECDSLHLSSDNLGPGDGENGQGEGGDGRDDKGGVKDGQHCQHLEDHHVDLVSILMQTMMMVMFTWQNESL